jgi:predicted RNA-binding Zn-ribbon protein involved in translation (DUF1610 family)
MAIITKPGKAQPQWPIGYTFTCPACGCQFILDDSDLDGKFSVGEVSPPMPTPDDPVRQYLTGPCPECGQTGTFYR